MQSTFGILLLSVAAVTGIGVLCGCSYLFVDTIRYAKSENTPETRKLMGDYWVDDLVFKVHCFSVVFVVLGVFDFLLLVSIARHLYHAL